MLRGSTSIQLSQLDISPAIQAGALEQQAAVNLAGSVNQAIQNFQVKKEQKEQEKIGISAIQNMLGIDDPNVAKAVYKDPAVRDAYNKSEEIKLKRAELFSELMPDATQQGFDLESQQTYYVPPDEDNPAGRYVTAGFTTSADPTSGIKSGQQVFYDVGSGSFKELPMDAEPFVAGNVTANRGILAEQRKDIRTTVKDLKVLKRYAGSREKMDQGIDFLTNRFLAAYNTLIKKPLNEQEFLTLRSRADFQSLLGKIRTEVLGPGVLTEFDARRLEEALGRFGATSNPAVVKEIMGDLINEKVESAKSSLLEYNQTRLTNPTLAREFKEFDMDLFDKFTIDTNFVKPLDESSDELVPDGIDPDVWKFMTEEERDTFR
jgi:hypothetical protein